MKALVLAAATLVAAAAHAQGQSRYEEPGRPDLFPKNYGYKDTRPDLSPPNYGYRRSAPAPAEPWRNPYANSGRDSSSNIGIRPPRRTDTLGTPREPLGGDPWAPRRSR